MTGAELVYLIVRAGGAEAVVTAMNVMQGKLARLEEKLARETQAKEDTLAESERVLALRTAERDGLREELVALLAERAEWEKQQEARAAVPWPLLDLLGEAERLLEGRMGYNVTHGGWLRLQEKVTAARRAVALPPGSAAACEGVDGAAR